MVWELSLTVWIFITELLVREYGKINHNEGERKNAETGCEIWIQVNYCFI